MTMTRPNRGATANGFTAVRSNVAGVRERMVRSTTAAELGRLAEKSIALTEETLS